MGSWFLGICYVESAMSPHRFWWFFYGHFLTYSDLMTRYTGIMLKAGKGKIIVSVF